MVFGRTYDVLDKVNVGLTRGARGRLARMRVRLICLVAFQRVSELEQSQRVLKMCAPEYAYGTNDPWNVVRHFEMCILLHAFLG